MSQSLHFKDLLQGYIFKKGNAVIQIVSTYTLEH